METQQDTSKNVIDHRKIARHGLVGFLSVLLGLFVGRAAAPNVDADRDLVQVVSTALDRGQDFWAARIPDRWRAARVVLIEGSERTACGVADSSSGPFYCPTSERIFVDMPFLRAIGGKLGRAYVIAHELGHHVQKLRGDLARLVDRPIDVELQADCYAGMWMHEEQTHGHLEPGDFPEALAEAAAVGDDRLRPDSSPEAWTHGSAAQRAQALADGFGGGPCNVK